MFDDFDNFEQAFGSEAADADSDQPTRPLRIRKPLRERCAFWAINAMLLPLVGLIYGTVGAEGLRRSMGIFSMRLYKLPVPGAGLLQRYDGWNRLDLSMLMAMVLFAAVTLIWIRVFKLLMNPAGLRLEREKNPVLFYLLITIAVIIVAGDAALFYVGLSSQAASSWGATSPIVPLGATVIYSAGLAAIGAYHADFHCCDQV